MDDSTQCLESSSDDLPRLRVHDRWCILKRHWPLALLLLCSVWPLYAGLSTWENQGDDTYITLTYSKNLANGHGFSYNGSLPSLGTTSPLFALLIGALAYVFNGIDTAFLGVMVSVLCWLAAAWAIYLGHKALSLTPSQASIVGAAVLMGGWWSLGNEFYPFQLLLVLAVIAANASRCALAGVLTGCLFVMRGEGALLLPLLVLFRWAIHIRRWRECKRDMFWDAAWLTAGFASVFCIWGAYSLHTFGSVFPDTLQVKLSQRRLGFETALENKLLLWSRYWWFRPGYDWLSWLYRGLSIAGGISIVLRHRNLAPLLLWPATYLGAYIAIRVPAYFWYQYSAYFIWVMLVGLGTAHCMHVLTRSTNRYARVAGGACSVLLIFSVLALHVWVRPLWPYGRDPRAPGYRQLCSWLNDNVDKNGTVAVAEVGYVGYFSDLRVADLMGLTSTELQPYAMNGDFLGGFMAVSPEVYVDRVVPNIPFLECIRNSGFLAREYRKAATIHDPTMPMTLDIYTRIRER